MTNIKPCAYCRRLDRALTREHLLPHFLHERTRDLDVQFLRAAPGRLVDGEHTIRDVCENCNNGVLSQLDEYATKLFDRFFHTFIVAHGRVEFVYDFGRLLRWLLKLSYNSARANKSTSTDTERLAELAPYILHGTPEPPRVAIYLLLVIPYNEETPPDIIRIGNANVSAFADKFAIARMIALKSYNFIVLMPASDAISRQVWRRDLHQAETEFPGAHRLDAGRKSMTITASAVTIREVIEKHLLPDYVDGLRRRHEQKAHRRT
jgi:hypothetical protein